MAVLEAKPLYIPVSSQVSEVPMMSVLYGNWIDLREDHELNKLIAGDPFLDDSWTSSPNGDIHSQVDPEAYAWQKASAGLHSEISRREFGIDRKPYPL